jgi:hypothetical protein
MSSDRDSPSKTSPRPGNARASPSGEDAPNRADPAHARDKPFKVHSSARADAAGAEEPATPHSIDAKVIEALSEAQSLMGYAANAGLQLDDGIIQSVVAAREARIGGTWSSKIEADLYSALSKLAARVKPVTSETLADDWEQKALRAATNYFNWTVILTFIIIPLSIVMFIDTSLSDEVAQLISENDAAAIKIHDEVINYKTSMTGSGASAAAISAASTVSLDLKTRVQQFARINRQLLGRSEVLNSFVFGMAVNPYDSWWEKTAATRRANLELDLTKVESAEGLASEAVDKIAVFQDIRGFAKDVQQRNLIFYGAVTTYALPIFYSLLGACAFALRNLSAQTRARTYMPRSYANFARLIIALIAGTVIGLFGNFTQGVSVSPLGIAFLVGYSVEVFFSFLDAFVQTFQKGRGGVDEPLPELSAR